MNNLSLQLHLLVILQKNKGMVNIADLSTRLKCSMNTIIRRIEDINQTLLSEHKLKIYKDKVLGMMVSGDVNAIKKVSDALKENNQYTTWRNREERELLILLKLISSKIGISKLLVLADSVNVAEATVLKDIKRLNLLFSPVVISSRQGTGTKFEGDNKFIQIKMIDFCYGILSPMNFIAISYDIGLAAHEELHACSSELFLSFVSEYIDIETIIERINAWEETQLITLNDIAFANLLLYIIIFELRKISRLIIESENGQEIYELHSNVLIDCDNKQERYMLDDFLLGLDENILNKYTNDKNINAIEHSTHIAKKVTDVVARHYSAIAEHTVHALTKSLLMLEYRHDSMFLYWDDELLSLYQGRLRKNIDFINQLQTLCDELSCDWVTLDSLLHILDLYVDELGLSSINVTLFCVAGVNTALMMKKMIERYCPLLRVSKICSLRNYTENDLKGNVILSTAESEVLPLRTIIVHSFFKAQEWLRIQEKALELVKK